MQQRRSSSEAYGPPVSAPPFVKEPPRGGTGRVWIWYIVRIIQILILIVFVVYSAVLFWIQFGTQDKPTKQPLPQPTAFATHAREILALVIGYMFAPSSVPLGMFIWTAWIGVVLVLFLSSPMNSTTPPSADAYILSVIGSLAYLTVQIHERTRCLAFEPGFPYMTLDLQLFAFPLLTLLVVLADLVLNTATYLLRIPSLRCMDAPNAVLICALLLIQCPRTSHTAFLPFKATVFYAMGWRENYLVSYQEVVERIQEETQTLKVKRRTIVEGDSGAARSRRATQRATKKTPKEEEEEEQLLQTPHSRRDDAFLRRTDLPPSPAATPRRRTTASLGTPAQLYTATPKSPATPLIPFYPLRTLPRHMCGNRVFMDKDFVILETVCHLFRWLLVALGVSMNVTETITNPISLTSVSRDILARLYPYNDTWILSLPNGKTWNMNNSLSDPTLTLDNLIQIERAIHINDWLILFCATFFLLHPFVHLFGHLLRKSLLGLRISVFIRRQFAKQTTLQDEKPPLDIINGSGSVRRVWRVGNGVNRPYNSPEYFPPTVYSSDEENEELDTQCCGC